MTWFSWELTLFGLGILVAIAFIWWSYRITFARHPIGDETLGPSRRLLAAIAVLAMRTPALTCSMALILVGLVQEGDVMLSYVLAAILGPACLGFIYANYRYRDG
jgi:hypothetical protein